MKNKISIFANFLNPRVIRAELKIIRRIALNYGHLNSVVEKSSIDKEGNPLPWYIYPSIEYLIQFDYKKQDIFEWGSGNSTLFWAKRARQVISIEDDSKWYEKVKSEALKNMKLNLVQEKKEYIQSIGDFNKSFDIIVIDAKYRQECAEIAPKYLKKSGFIIFDNSDRYPKTCKKLKKVGNYIQVDFSGFSCINDYTHTTSLFFSRDLELKVKGNQPTHSLASLNELCE